MMNCLFHLNIHTLLHDFCRPDPHNSVFTHAVGPREALLLGLNDQFSDCTQIHCIWKAVMQDYALYTIRAVMHY